MNNKKKKVISFLVVFVILLVLALIFYGFTNRATLSEDFANKISIYGAPALLIVALILDLIPQVVSPVIMMGVGILAGINLHYAVLATILGSLIGSTIGFTLGKKYMYQAVDVLASKKSVTKLTDLTNKYGRIIIPLAAISPLPYLPVVIGTMNFSKRNFIFFGLIPRALGILAYGYLFGIF